MLRKAVVHIGPMKTGTTSIQRWLARKADLLERHGIHPIRALGENMSRLSVLAMARVLDTEPVAADRERLSRAFAEIAALPESIHTLVISGELLGWQLTKPRQVRAFKELFDGVCDDYRIVTYLRRQDELSVSLYSTALRRGEPRARQLSRAFDYEALLDAWSGVFGREAIVARLYDRATLEGGDVVRDFADAAGLPFEPLEGEDANRNLGLRPEAQQFLVDLTRRAREAGFDRPLADSARMADLIRVLDRDFAGAGMRPSQSEVLAFYDGVRASNEAVRRAWFPERTTLFREDFSEYPETAPTPPPAGPMLDVAMTVLTDLLVGGTEVDADAQERRALAERMREFNRASRRNRRGGAAA